MRDRSSRLAARTLPALARLERVIRHQVATWQAHRKGETGTNEAAALAGLRTTSPSRRWEAAAILARSSQRSPEAIAALVAAMGDAEPFVRWQAAEALAAQEPNRVFGLLTATLADPLPLLRSGAARALGHMGGEASTMMLRAAVSDPEPSVRMAVADALGCCGDPTSLIALVPLLGDPDPDVRRAAAYSLGRIAIGDAATAASLAAALAEPDQPLLVRRALAAALAHAPHPDAQPVLLDALNDADPQVRGYAAKALGQIGDETVYAALASLLADDSRLLRGTVADWARRARTMLERRGRQGFAPGPTEVRQ